MSLRWNDGDRRRRKANAKHFKDAFRRHAAERTGEGTTLLGQSMDKTGTVRKRNHEKAEERGTVTDGREGSIVSGGRGKAEEAAAGQVFGGGKREGAKSRIIQWKRKVFAGKGGKINAAVSV